METTTIVPATRLTSSAEPNPNPYNIKAGETVIMDAEVGNPRSVKVDKVGNNSYSAHVVDVETGKKWVLTMNCLSRVTETDSNS